MCDIDLLLLHLYLHVCVPACLHACVPVFSLSPIVLKKDVFFTYRSIFLFQFHVHMFLSHPPSATVNSYLSPLPLLYRLTSYYPSMHAYMHSSIHLSMYPRMSRKHKWPAPANLGIHSTNVNECLHVQLVSLFASCTHSLACCYKHALSHRLTHRLNTRYRDLPCKISFYKPLCE